MSISAHPSKVEEFIRLQTAEGRGKQQIEELMNQGSFTADEMAEAHNLLGSANNSQRRKVGVAMVVIGAFLCLFGFLITMFLIQHEVNFSMALYGTTGLGGTLLLGGMVAILG